jgi:hypothetical protein
MTTLTQERLRQLFWYDPIVGIFVRRTAAKGPGNGIGFIPSKGNQDGYIRLMIDGVRYQAHRLAIFYVTGVMPDPDNDVDHKNGRENDNSFDNLRPATHAQNMANQGVRSSNTSGISGVWFDKDSGKWRADIRSAGRRIHIGRFTDKDKAAEARRLAETTHYGEFACLRP